MKKYNVNVSIPIEYDTSELINSFEHSIEVKAESYDDAVLIAIDEFSENCDLDSIYDEIYGELNTNMLVWLDGNYECDLTDADYYFPEQVKEKKDE